jgi:4a-hydroxytetrahydrobiopterin dehydratase
MVSKRLSTGDIKNELEDLPGWKVEGDTIVRTFTFSDFVEAFAFMTELAMVSEKLNHHPNWSNSYNTLKVSLSTHDSGGISEKDIEWATHCNQRYNQQM